MALTKQSSAAIVGGLSEPSKMPGKAFGLPALAACPIGRKLAATPGTPCSTCYATRNMYVMPNVKAAQAQRLARVRRALSNPTSREYWVASMVRLLDGEPYFRWHDSGDIFSMEYLELILDVVRKTPETRHWLPTQERATVAAWLRLYGAFPANLTVRVSMPLIDAPAKAIEATQRGLGIVTSSVSTMAPTCPARNQGNACLDCRACWDSNVKHVAYAKH